MQLDISSLLPSEGALSWSCTVIEWEQDWDAPFPAWFIKTSHSWSPLSFPLLGKDGKSIKWDETRVSADKRVFNWNAHIRLLQHKVNIHCTSEIWEFVYCSLITHKGWRARNCQHGSFFSHIWTNGYNSTRVTLSSSVMWYVEGFNWMPLTKLILPHSNAYVSF